MNPQLSSRYIAAKKRLFDVYYGNLNPEQREAVFTINGPLLILAGAGSGKTTVLVQRIAYMIKYGNAYFCDRVPDDITEADVAALEGAASLEREDIEEILPEFISSPCPPWAVLAITFTNKAAGEISERIATALGDKSVSDEIWAGTFHKICMRILRRHGELIGYADGFSIYDTDDKKRLVIDSMKALNISDDVLQPKAVMSAISAAKDNLQTPEDMPEGKAGSGSALRDRTIKQIYTEYQSRLRRANALDFDDIIMQTVLLFEKFPEVLERYQKRFRYVSIDEYQDTNPAQFKLSEMLSAGTRNLMAVGDDDQSIYRFRGATVENILNFDKVFPDARVIKLEQNYRSTKTILRAANGLIANNIGRRGKELWTEGEEGAPITLRRNNNQLDEARFVTDRIMHMVVHDRLRYRDFAVLYRVNEVSRALEAAFVKSGIPYRLLGSQRFYDRKEIRDVAAYLYLIANPADDNRLKRIINLPARGIGATTLSAVSDVASELGVSMFEVISRVDEFPLLSKARAKLSAFAQYINGMREKQLPPSKLIDEVFTTSGYLGMLEAEGEESIKRIDSVREFISSAMEYEKLHEDATLEGFLEEVVLISDVDKYDEDADAVVLMTIHSAKGLEFPIVILAGAEDEIFPGTQIQSHPEQLEEERRLAYVAVTRAKRQLIVSYSCERLLYGRTTPSRLSRFIKNEIPPELLRDDLPTHERRTGGFAPPRKQKPEISGEFLRRADVSRAAPIPSPKPRPAASAASAGGAGGGFARFGAGARVVHPVFGAGIVLSARDMGGDMLYEVAFDNGQKKKLMATYAKLRAE